MREQRAHRCTVGRRILLVAAVGEGAWLTLPGGPCKVCSAHGVSDERCRLWAAAVVTRGNGLAAVLRSADPAGPVPQLLGLLMLFVAVPGLLCTAVGAEQDKMLVGDGQYRTHRL
jgi:hypothetical protein